MALFKWSVTLNYVHRGGRGGFYIVQCPILRIFVRFHLIFDQTKISDLNEIIHISGNIKSTKMADHLLEW